MSPNLANTSVQLDHGNAAASAVVLDINAAASDITLDANDSLNISSGKSLTLSGPLVTTINGSVVTNGTLSATGISVGAGGSLSVMAGASIAVSSSFVNQGTVLLGGLQTWSSGSTFNNTSGTATFASDASTTATGNLRINVVGGAVVFSSTQHLLALNISSGATATAGGTGVLVTSSLAVAGKLDLSNSALDLQTSGPNSLSLITALVNQGYNNGKWNGSTGILSSTAAGATTHLTAIGVIQNNQTGTALYTAANLFKNTAPGVSDILAKYTYYGDTNLDGKVDGSDYSRTDAAYLADKINPAAATGWFNGDFNYDGLINGSDYTLLDNAYNTQSAILNSQFAAIHAGVADQVANWQTAVPEPSTLGFFSLCFIGIKRHRRSASAGSDQNKVRKNQGQPVAFI